MPFNVLMRFREKSLLPYLLKYNKLLFRLFSSTLLLSMKKKPLLLQNLFSLLLRGQNDVTVSLFLTLSLTLRILVSLMLKSDSHPPKKFVFLLD